MKQVILCVETNKKAKTDVGYIDAVIKKLYQIGTEIKLQYKYFNGKGGYNAPKLLKEIKNDIAALKGTSSSEVIYCIDTDKYDSEAEVQKLNADIENFCHQNGYKFIWFCRDVEEVFLHKTVEGSKKKAEVAKFKSGNNLGKATKATLSVNSMAKKKSNMLLVLDQVLDRKQ